MTADGSGAVWHDRGVQPRTTDDSPVDERPTVSTAAAAGVTALLGGAVLSGAAFAGPLPQAIAILVAQLALVTTWCVVTRPPGTLGSAVVGVLTAIAADAVALATGDRGAGALVAVLACAFGATTFTQLARGVARRNVTESFGSTLTVAVAVTALATTIALRRAESAELIALIGIAAALGMIVARLADLVLPRPGIHPDVPRGLVGPVLGSALAAGGSALAVVLGLDLPLGPATLVGWLVGTAAVLADLAVDFARAGRIAAGGRSTGGIGGAALGPLAALAVAAPIGYLAGLSL